MTGDKLADGAIGADKISASSVSMNKMIISTAQGEVAGSGSADISVVVGIGSGILVNFTVPYKEKKEQI